MSKEKQVVWIRCRAQEDDRCSGNQAEIVFSKSVQNQLAAYGEHHLDLGGGRMTRYRCQTCNGIFTIST